MGRWVTTVQLEFKYLAHLTGETYYWETVEKVMQVIEAIDGRQHRFIYMLQTSDGSVALA